jgi:hypothetical protein
MRPFLCAGAPYDGIQFFLAPDSIYAEIDSGSVRPRTVERFSSRAVYESAQTGVFGATTIAVAIDS